MNKFACYAGRKKGVSNGMYDGISIQNAYVQWLL
jgi:hypothetical protein